MCGITGILSKDTDKVDLIKKMSKRIAHRGPDGEAYFIDNSIALAHRRLAVLDLDTGTQPMMNEDENLVLVFNGEIYNYIELKGQLIKEGHHFKTTSDSEVLLHGYEKWGKDLPKYLRGMFAFAIWDRKKKVLFLARDHFGMKPLYFYHDDASFVFASELKAFLSYTPLKREFDSSLLPSYLAFGFTPGNKTFIKGIEKLAPGHSLLIKNDKVLEEKYFDLSFAIENEPLTTTVSKIQNVLSESVKRHLLADVEVGCFLSSGVDSSYIASLAKTPKTFTIGYANYKDDEIGHAKHLADKLEIENREVYLTKGDYLASINLVAYYIDEPSGDPSIIALYHLSSLAKKDVKVVLSGEGADEFFGGYNNYLDEMHFWPYNLLPFKVRQFISNVLSNTPEFKGRNFLVRRGKKLEEYYTGVNRNLSDNDIKKCLKDPDISHLNSEIMKVLKDISSQEEIVQKQIVDISCWLSNDILHKADRMGMANSIETRLPFTDVAVFKVARTLSKDKKISLNKTKVALRQASRQVIPTEAYKKKKLGFPVPLREWLKEPDFYSEIKKTFEKSKGNIYFDCHYLTELLENHRQGKKDNYKKIWTIYMFLKWYDIYFQ